MKRNEFNDLAAEMEAACGDWENSDGLSEKALSELIAKVEAMDAEASGPKREEPTLKSKKKFRLKKRYIFVLAAALVLVMGTGVVGDRVWISDSRDMERESEITTKVNNEDKESVPYQEDEVYQEIADKLFIKFRLKNHLPLTLDSYLPLTRDLVVGAYQLLVVALSWEDHKESLVGQKLYFHLCAMLFDGE